MSLLKILRIRSISSMTTRAHTGILTGPILTGLLALKYSLNVAFRAIAVLLPAFAASARLLTRLLGS